jgi:DNA polymerase bacteriophage-type
MDLLIDFETYSDQPIETVSTTKYCRDESTVPLCMAYKPFHPDDLKQEYDTKLWLPGQVFPDISKYDHVWAFNTAFDFQIFQYKILPSRSSLPDVPLNCWKDIQVVLSKFSLPQNLEDAAAVTGAKIQKHPDGKLIINRCCKRNSNQPSEEDYKKLYLYCVQDIDASLEILRACPSILISDYEWRLWRLTCQMNFHGLPIDYEAVEAIKQRVDAHKVVIQEMLPEITNGEITTPNQHARIKKFLNARGVMVKNTMADTLEKLMEEPEKLPEDCRMLIKIRQAAGASSVAKFDKLLDMRIGDKVHDFLRYGATNTQRWAGAGFQVHSLPKKTVDDPEALIRAFIDQEYIENPIQSAKALCRSVIQAPSGQMLYQADYSSIEYLLLIWITDMHGMLQFYKDDKSAYIDMAAYLFNKQYDEIDKHANDNLEYFLGKQVILGCGYQMGAKKFRETCARYGQKISLEMAEYAIKGYRTKYKPIAIMWKSVHNACIAAIQNYGMKYETNKCLFNTAKDHRGRLWLIIELPSGTKLYYADPELAEGNYGPEIKHMGLQDCTWCRRYLSPGRITENIIQKLARDLMAYGIYTVANSPEFLPLMTVHDELVSLGSDAEPELQLRKYFKLMEQVPTWAKAIPLRAGGYYGKRYKKD